MTETHETAAPGPAAAAPGPTPAAIEPLLVMTRVIAGRRDAVFSEWCKPERLARWWDPDRRIPPWRVEREGDGTYRVRMCAADGSPYWLELAIWELASPERIVFTWGSARSETLTLVTVTLTDQGKHTRLVLEQSIAKPRVPRAQLGAA